MLWADVPPGQRTSRQMLEAIKDRAKGVEDPKPAPFDSERARCAGADPVNAFGRTMYVPCDELPAIGNVCAAHDEGQRIELAIGLEAIISQYEIDGVPQWAGVLVNFPSITATSGTSSGDCERELRRALREAIDDGAIVDRAELMRELEAIWPKPADPHYGAGGEEAALYHHELIPNRDAPEALPRDMIVEPAIGPIGTDTLRRELEAVRGRFAEQLDGGLDDDAARAVGVDLRDDSATVGMGGPADADDR